MAETVCDGEDGNVVSDVPMENNVLVERCNDPEFEWSQDGQNGAHDGQEDQCAVEIEHLSESPRHGDPEGWDPGLLHLDPVDHSVPHEEPDVDQNVDENEEHLLPFCRHCSIYERRMKHKQTNKGAFNIMCEWMNEAYKHTHTHTHKHSPLTPIQELSPVCHPPLPCPAVCNSVPPLGSQVALSTCHHICRDTAHHHHHRSNTKKWNFLWQIQMRGLDTIIIVSTLQNRSLLFQFLHLIFYVTRTIRISNSLSFLSYLRSVMDDGWCRKPTVEFVFVAGFCYLLNALTCGEMHERLT